MSPRVKLSLYHGTAHSAAHFRGRQMAQCRIVRTYSVCARARARARARAYVCDLHQRYWESIVSLLVIVSLSVLDLLSASQSQYRSLMSLSVLKAAWPRRGIEGNLGTDSKCTWLEEKLSCSAARPQTAAFRHRACRREHPKEPGEQTLSGYHGHGDYDFAKHVRIHSNTRPHVISTRSLRLSVEGLAS